MKRFVRARKNIEDPNLQIMELNKCQARKMEKKIHNKKILKH